MFVKANAGAEDKYYIAGHIFRIISGSPKFSGVSRSFLGAINGDDN